jgi:Recombinase zinc beta ribbon domain
VAIPVPHVGIPRELVEAARAMVKDNRPPAKTGRRFWQIPSAAIRCKYCGKTMLKVSAGVGDKVYAYYKCSRLIHYGKDGCCPDRVRTYHRAAEVERRVWEVVSDLMKNPEQLRDDLERMIELEKQGVRGDPDVEAKAWLDKLAETEAERRGFLRLAARGSITDAELDEALAELEETRSTAETELAALKNRQEAIEALERDKEALLGYYASIAPEALDSLTPEERHQLYRMLRLEVIVRPDANLEVSGVFGESVSLSNTDLVPSYVAVVISRRDPLTRKESPT